MCDRVWSIRVLGYAHWATFCTLMNKIFHPYSGQFVVVYLDDIMVCSKTLEDHVAHLRTFFKVLREKTLYVKREKCSLATRSVLPRTLDMRWKDMDGQRQDAGHCRMV